MKIKKEGRLRVAPRQQLSELGVTLFEFAVVIVVFGILLAVLLDRVRIYKEQAELAGMHMLVGNMQSALNNRLLAAQARGQALDRVELAMQNPISWLERVPENYAGEGDDLTQKPLSAGRWYFDRTGHCLIYVFSRKKSFLEDSIERRYFKVEFLRLPTKPAKPHGTTGQDGGVALIQVDGG